MVSVTETPLAMLSVAAQAQRGIQPDQKNILLRLVIRDPTRTLASAEANALCGQVFLAIHQGATSEPPGP
jgi:phenylalanyl-tRNA synthetase alpha chain